MEGEHPPPLSLLVRSIQVGSRRYAVGKGSVCSTQSSCYIVRRHQILLLKGALVLRNATNMTYMY